MEQNGNQWAYVTNVAFESGFVEMSDYANNHIVFPGQQSIRFSGVAPFTPQIMQAMTRWLNKPNNFPFYNSEWMCLYCGVPNPLPLVKCLQCNGPRNWLLG